MSEKSTYAGLSEDEIAAMKERTAELKASSKRGAGAKKAEADLADCLAKLAEMDGTDKAVGETLHRIVTTVAPDLAPKTWYGMPAYARDGKVIVFFKPAAKFKVRYAEVGFNEFAQLDDGDIWPTVYAVTAMNAAIEMKLTELITRAAG
ncbi:hypothetical protein [Nocardioides cavernaquae]|uniref:DUF1801 domain-containing protein n=1 Tax=Nocardioides cavernaquae TaxID=2321396 RepID=A0A3A5HF05_9ACTN|nr:hypothetical protein [Nocardioides cavernaquae]RJS46570.1 hypothetical protein D4739_10335 [Nocardioides cavernaquae]